MKRNSIIISSIMVVVAILNTAVYRSVKAVWFFIDKELGSIFGIDNFWSLCIWFFLLAFSLYSTALLIISIKKSKIAFNRSRNINLIILLLLNIIFCILNLYVYNELGPDKHIVVRNLISALPWVLFIGLIVFFIIFFPILKLSKNSKVRYFIAGLLIICVLIYLLDLGDVQITSGPYFQYIDDNNYAVIWTTNKKSTGWVDYGPNEEQLSRNVSSDKGLINASSTVHKVILPIKQDTATVFRVGSTKINNYYQNNIEYGNTVYSNFTKYEDMKDETTFYVLSDIHERKEIYKKFLTKDDYDFLVLNGDQISSVDSEDIIVSEMLKPISLYTEGFKPFYFVRGNHEPRGASARELPNYLALPNDSYYYTFTYGSVFAIVLDSGEEKLDSHEEYSGLSDFEDYRSIETQWLKEVAQSKAYKDAKYKIAFAHVPLNSYGLLEDSSPLKSYQKEWIEILNNIGIDALFSGHTHKSGLIKANTDSNNFPIMIGGGNSGDGESYIGIKVDVKDDYMEAYFINEDGQIIEEYKINK